MAIPARYFLPMYSTTPLTFVITKLHSRISTCRGIVMQQNSPALQQHYSNLCNIFTCQYFRLFVRLFYSLNLNCCFN